MPQRCPEKWRAQVEGVSPVFAAEVIPMSPLITVVIATRDRPALFAEALKSVLDQDLPTPEWLEVLVVNDGTDPTLLPAYEQVWAQAAQALGGRFGVHHLARRPKGHGQSYALNHGCALARADHVAFLDDDDYWTDRNHLRRVCAALSRGLAQNQPVDLYMANQEAWRVTGEKVGVLWLGDLAPKLQGLGRQPDELGLYPVDVDDLMRSDGFCHLNALTVRKALFEQVGGMDEGIRWECDRDLLLKLMDQASVMLHDPSVMSYHRVPDPSKANNMTTALGMLDKRVLQSLVMDKALARSRHPGIRAHVRVHKVYALERMALAYAERQDWTSARFMAGMALGARPSPGRLGLWLKCLWRALFTPL